MKLIELRKQGYKALVDSLGVAGMIRFLQQFDVGEGDYTKEHYQELDHLTMEDFRSYIRKQRAKNEEGDKKC